MIVVDTETTGVDAKLCSLLSVGALDFDTPSNQFYMECYAFAGAHIERKALKVSGFTLEEITPVTFPSKDWKGQVTPSLISPSEEGERKSLHAAGSGAPFMKGRIKSTDREVVEEFLEWMKTCKEWTLAGQNPSFDRDFLQETAHRHHLNWPLAHRTLDLHSVAYAEFMRAGKEVPLTKNHSALNLDAILVYVGLSVERGSHNALQDAKLEAESFSRLLRGKPLLDEYRRFPMPRTS